MIKVASNGNFWTLLIEGASGSPHKSVRRAVPGITGNDYYWAEKEIGVVITFYKLQDAEKFVANGGPVMVKMGSH